MRNLEECRAEIFRLGEKKIKKRKQTRKRIIAACIPLCFCLAVFSMTLMPQKLPKSDVVGGVNVTTTGKTNVGDVGDTNTQSQTVVEEGTIYQPTTGCDWAPDSTTKGNNATTQVVENTVTTRAEETVTHRPTTGNCAPETTHPTQSTTTSTPGVLVKHISVEVDGFGSISYHDYIDDLSRVEKIADMIADYFAENEIITNPDESEYKGGVYITIESRDHSKVIYALYSDALKNTSNGEFIYLNDSQLTNLLYEIKGWTR